MNRRCRRRSLLVASVIFLIGAGVFAAPAAYARYTATDWNRHKPVWWLVRETNSRDCYTVWFALSELLKRDSASQLPHETVRLLALRALQRRDEADPQRLWPNEFGNFLDLAWERGLLTDEQKFSYAFNAIGVWWTGPMHRRYPGARPNPILAVYLMAYVGVSTHSISNHRPIDYEVHAFEAWLDGEALETNLRVRRFDTDEDGGRDEVSIAFAQVELPDDWVGRGLRLAWRVQVVDFKTREPIGEPWSDSRTLALMQPIEYGGARRQDDKPPPKQ